MELKLVRKGAFVGVRSMGSANGPPNNVFRRVHNANIVLNYAHVKLFARLGYIHFKGG